jgi:hypothetical protein
MNWEPATPFSQMMPMFAGQLDHRMIVYLLGRPDVEYVEAGIRFPKATWTQTRGAHSRTRFWVELVRCFPAS